MSAPAETSVQKVREAFVERFGGEPDGVWASPGRVNLIGEHTDYNGGLCLPIALPQRTFAAVRARDDDRLVLASCDVDGVAELDIDEVAPGRPQGWASYLAGVVWALREAGHPVRGVDVVVHSTVPIGAGLSSSAALEGSLGTAASDLFGLDLLASDEGRAQLAKACQRAENHIAQAPTGGLDQAASLRTTEGHALLLDCRDGSIGQVPFDLTAHDLELLVCDTRAEHALVDGQYAERRASCEQAAELLGVETLREIEPSGLEAALLALPNDLLRKRTRHVVTEIQRVRDTIAALERDDYAEVGRLFDESHESLRLDFEVTCPELDVAVVAARAAGALGARMTGGGFGGSCIALIPAGTADQITAAIEAAYSEQGFAPPSCFAAVAAAPGGRVS